MIETMQAIIDSYKNGTLNRRAFINRLIGITGSMAAAHMVLESSGLAATLISEVESQQGEVSSETVEYPGADGAPLSGYLSTPQHGDKFPAVIVIHENRGLNDHIRDVARRFAAEGFVALAPDLLSRKGGTGAMASPDKARGALSTLPPEDAIADLKAGLEYLDRHIKVRSGRFASVGFCWGGARSFMLAAESEQLQAAVVFYGSAPPPDKLAHVGCPVLGLYGETDERITSRVPEVAEAMKQYGKQFEYKVYSSAGHAFFNDTSERYNPDAAKDAWKRSLEFLHTHLR